MKIITSMGSIGFSKMLQNKLPKYEVIEDVPYIEGVVDLLNISTDVVLIIIKLELLNAKEVFKIIAKIKSKDPTIEIIVFLDKDDLKTRQVLSTYGINKIFLNNSLKVNDLVSIIDNDTKLNQKSLELEIVRLKEKLFNQPIVETKNKFPFNIKAKLSSLLYSLHNKNGDKIKESQIKNVNTDKSSQKAWNNRDQTKSPFTKDKTFLGDAFLPQKRNITNQNLLILKQIESKYENTSVMKDLKRYKKVLMQSQNEKLKNALIQIKDVMRWNK